MICPVCQVKLDSPTHGDQGGQCDTCHMIWTDVRNSRCLTDGCDGTVRQCMAPFELRCMDCNDPLRNHKKGEEGACTYRSRPHPMAGRGRNCNCKAFVYLSPVQQAYRELIYLLRPTEYELLNHYVTLCIEESSNEMFGGLKRLERERAEEQRRV